MKVIVDLCVVPPGMGCPRACTTVKVNTFKSQCPEEKESSVEALLRDGNCGPAWGNPCAAAPAGQSCTRAPQARADTRGWSSTGHGRETASRVSQQNRWAGLLLRTPQLGNAESPHSSNRQRQRNRKATNCS